MDKIAAALVKARRAFGPALKDKNNPAFRSKYADLGACLDAVDDALLTNGIAIIQETFEDPTGVTVETVFLHESGQERRCGKLHVPAAKQDPQGYGSALTYARRYSLMAACGIAPEDDDGNAASKRQPVSTAMSGQNVSDWIGYITESATAGDLKNRLAEALDAAAEVNDTAAAAKFNKAAADKVAAAKNRKTEGAPA
jgi:hypothetical protein